MNIKSIGLSGIVVLNAHDLNNEGSEGNITIERRTNVLYEGKIVSVNSISGDMLKHGVAQYINRFAKEDGITLCKGCQVDHSNRINMEDPKNLKTSDGKKLSDEDLVNKVIQMCAGDDLNGIMITEKTIGNVHRKSCFESAMLIGIPDQNETDRAFHVKFSKEETKKGSDDDSGNKGQNIFYRPSNSGKYATVMFINAENIGKNDFTHEYAIDETERDKRFKILIKAVMSNYVNLNGAQRNTMLPHISNFDGIVTISHSSLPAPTLSALNPNYKEEIVEIAGSMNRVSENSIEVKNFSSLSEFVKILTELQ